MEMGGSRSLGPLAAPSLAAQELSAPTAESWGKVCPAAAGRAPPRLPRQGEAARLTALARPPPSGGRGRPLRRLDSSGRARGAAAGRRTRRSPRETMGGRAPSSLSSPGSAQPSEGAAALEGRRAAAAAARERRSQCRRSGALSLRQPVPAASRSPAQSRERPQPASEAGGESPSHRPGRPLPSPPRSPRLCAALAAAPPARAAARVPGSPLLLPPARSPAPQCWRAPPPAPGRGTRAALARALAGPGALSPPGCSGEGAPRHSPPVSSLSPPKINSTAREFVLKRRAKLRLPTGPPLSMGSPLPVYREHPAWIPRIVKRIAPQL
ncbi:skin secretory protein xP2-like [Varanus komodoensis]|uniref:skin secretory protein xP2-like n=1 Tax=Varanus komodoensis TaxID=61221 RepID=UPI001CF780D0|nr:skin secretory protein xP2-like [Varanus komodoensis]